MSSTLRPPLSSFVDWLRQRDQHAAERITLLTRAETILDSQQEASHSDRADLAAALQQWRYRHLDRHNGKLGPTEQRLADALDLAANELLGRDARPPRSARAAVEDTPCDDGPIAQAADRAAACFDPDLSLEELAAAATELTRERFARPPCERQRVSLYAPLYLSSHCINHCVYCGFRDPHVIQRRHLNLDEATRQADILRDRGFRHVLLVAGDFPRLTTTDFFLKMVRMLRDRQISAALEIAPQTTASYAELAAAGVCGVTLYQETYSAELYALYHPRGSKASYDWRLEGLERAAEAGVGRLGLGILLGLADPREDLLAMVRHAGYLSDRFPDRTLAFSLPRIHEAPAGFQTPYPVDDETFVRLYCTLRVAFPEAELVLSTRESIPLRNRLAEICITQMSAGSSTSPGGYEEGNEPRSDQQFPVSDDRAPAEVARWLRTAGFELAWDVG